MDDLQVDSFIYVRGRAALVVNVDYPLVFWRWQDEGDSGVVRHRSFISSKELFQVAQHVSQLARVSQGPASDFDESDDWASFDANDGLPDNSGATSHYISP